MRAMFTVQFEIAKLGPSFIDEGIIGIGTGILMTGLIASMVETMTFLLGNVKGGGGIMIGIFLNW